MKRYDYLRKKGFTHLEAMDILKWEGADINEELLSSDTGYKIEMINRLFFSSVPDIALNDYDYLEDERFW